MRFLKLFLINSPSKVRLNNKKIEDLSEYLQEFFDENNIFYNDSSSDSWKIDFQNNPIFFIRIDILSSIENEKSGLSKYQKCYNELMRIKPQIEKRLEKEIIIEKKYPGPNNPTWCLKIFIGK